ncbi:MAG: hypothetical protein ABJZ55_25460 [Fuerstiella sp.]
MLIGGAFLTLFSAWALWGWTVGESRNIKPLRKTCGPIFVVTATLLVAGGTIMGTRASMKRQSEANVRALLTGIHDRLQKGQADLVQKQLQALIDENPDEDPKDLMANLPDAASALFVDKPKVQIATEAPNFNDHRRQ